MVLIADITLSFSDPTSYLIVGGIWLAGVLTVWAYFKSEFEPRYHDVLASNASYSSAYIEEVRHRKLIEEELMAHREMREYQEYHAAQSAPVAPAALSRSRNVELD